MMNLRINHLPLSPYLPIWEAMKAFTDQRDNNTLDEIWFLEHEPVFTQGLAGKAEHILNPHQIPVIQTDRGGQVTYHGPGQLVMYTLIDMKRAHLGPRQLVHRLEALIINLLSDFNISAQSNADAPGVYVNGDKICSIGLRVRKGCSYHGIALNVDMDLTPFSYINPCGYKNMKMAQVRDFVDNVSIDHVTDKLITKLKMEQLQET